VRTEGERRRGREEETDKNRHREDDLINLISLGNDESTIGTVQP